MKFISSIITAASGSIAGSTYSRNANGAYIRNKAIPTNNNTLAQQAARARFSTASIGWKNQTAVQKDSYAQRVSEYPYIDSLGQTKTYTASQLYKKLNGTLLQSSLAPLDGCNAPVALLQMGIAAIVADQSLGTITFDSFEFADATSIIPTGFQLNLYGTVVQGTGVTNPKESIFRLLGSFSAPTDMATETLTTPYNAIYGDEWTQASQLGNFLWFGFKLVSINTGQAYSAMFMASAPIIA